MSSQQGVQERFRLSGMLRDRSVSLVALIVITAIVMSLISPYFLTVDNLLAMTQFGAVVGLLALGQTLVILSGGAPSTYLSARCSACAASQWAFSSDLGYPCGSQQRPLCLLDWLLELSMDL